jgi:hypothetical protein
MRAAQRLPEFEARAIGAESGAEVVVAGIVIALPQFFSGDDVVVGLPVARVSSSSADA